MSARLKPRLIGLVKQQAIVKHRRHLISDSLSLIDER